MQRVSSLLPSWEKRHSSSGSSVTKASLDKVLGWGEKLGSSLNRLSTQAQPNQGATIGVKVSREVFWPATLDQECDRAARILKSFSCDGFLANIDDSPPTNTTTPSTPTKITKKIPQRIIQNAAGIAIFTCMRSGLWMTGSGGSGILVARKADGTWSPPAGILLHTPTLSFIMGVDIYDCVLIINDLAALETLMRPMTTLGDDVGLKTGPLVPVASTDVDVRWKELGNTVLTYMKARGQSQAVNLHGCIFSERGNENERFYNNKISILDILAGNVSRSVDEARPIYEVIKAGEGRTDFDAAIVENLSRECAPGDALIESPTAASPATPRSAFGIPDADDPDPFGVLALEMAGMEIREAGTRLRPSSNQFEFNPSPASPLHPKFQRQSVDTYPTLSNRGSVLSSRTTRTVMSDAGTQTDVANTPETTPSPSHSEDGRGRASFDPFGLSKEPEEVDYTKIDLTPLRNISGTHSLDGTTVAESMESPYPDGNESIFPRAADEQNGESEVVKERMMPKAVVLDEVQTAINTELPDDDDDDMDNYADDEDDEDDDEEAVVFEVVAAVQPVRTAVVATKATQAVQVKGALVTIPKRVPPPLPMRSPARNSRVNKAEIGDVVVQSPLRQSFNEEELRAADTEVDGSLAATESAQDGMSTPMPQTAEVKELVVAATKLDASQAPAASVVPPTVVVA